MQDEHETVATPDSTESAEPAAPPLEVFRPYPQLLLPRWLAPLAKACATEAARFAITGVRLELSSHHYLADATDGRILIRIRGPRGECSDYPPHPAVENAANGATTAIIPAKEWEKAFRQVPPRAFKPILENVAVVLSDKESTLATTNLETASAVVCRNVEGRYPRVEDVLPRKQPRFTISVDPLYLAKVCTILASLADPDKRGVTLEFYDDCSPIAMRVPMPRADHEAVGILMPLVSDTEAKGFDRKTKARAVLSGLAPRAINAIYRISRCKNLAEVKKIGGAVLKQWTKEVVKFPEGKRPATPTAITTSPNAEGGEE